MNSGEKKNDENQNCANRSGHILFLRAYTFCNGMLFYIQTKIILADVVFFSYLSRCDQFKKKTVKKNNEIEKKKYNSKVNRTK